MKCKKFILGYLTVLGLVFLSVMLVIIVVKNYQMSPHDSMTTQNTFIQYLFQYGLPGLAGFGSSCILFYKYRIPIKTRLSLIVRLFDFGKDKKPPPNGSD